MKIFIFFLLTIICFNTFCIAQTWQWAKAEPNGPAFYTGEDDAAHHVETDASGNVYVLGNFLGYLYLNNAAVTQGNGSYLAKYDPAGTLLWYQLITPDYANTSGDTYIKASDLVVNSSGIYITGKYNYSFGGADFNNNCNIVVGTQKNYKIGGYNFSSGIYDIGLFVAKFTFDGNVVWNKTATDFYTDQYNCLQPATCSNCGSAAYNVLLTSDPSNNLTIAFQYNPSFNLGAAGLIFDNTTITSNRTNSQGSDLIVISLNPDGNYRWSNTAFTNPYFLNYGYAGGELDCNSIVADNSGNIFITGQAGDHTSFGTDVINTTPAGSAIRYMAKLSSSGIWQFGKTLTKYSSVSSLQSFNYGAEANPSLLTIDVDNNVYALVNLTRLPIYEPQYILGNLVPDPAANSMYLLKMTNNGNAEWIKQFGWNYYQSNGYGLGIQYANNDLYLTGSLSSGRSGASFYQFGNLLVPSASTSSNGEYFVARADLSGEFKWASTFSAFAAAGYSIAVSGENIYTGGTYRKQIYSLGNFNVDRSATEDYYTSDIFFGKLKDQYIHVGTVIPTTVCPGSIINIPFTSYGLTFSGSNSFTAQLSDVDGNFSSATNIGSIVSTGSGSISATIPAVLPLGSSGYRIRLVSSDLLATGLPYYAYADINYSITVGNQTFYQDADEDGYGNPAVSLQTCTPPSNYVLNNTDCDDTKLLYADNDGDGYGAGATVACGVATNTDCNDNNANINPGKTEICGNGIDDNCNSQIDENCITTPAPFISINDVTVYESQSIAALTVSLSNSYTADIKVNYQTVDRTAVTKGKNKDYVSSRGSITIPSGSLTGTIRVSILKDDLQETDELFDVVISLPKSSLTTISKSNGTVTIKDGNAPINTKAKATTDKTARLINDFKITAYPNPGNSPFTLKINSGKQEAVSVKVTDILGRVVELRSGVSANSSIRFGNNYIPGTYIVEVQQGRERKQVKLIKLSE